MSKEFDLDKLKAAWQEKSAEKRYSSQEIFEMLKRKSITSVKWIFFISLFEIVLAVIFYAYFYFFNSYHLYLVEKFGDLAYVYEVLLLILFVGTFYFIYQFFVKYKKINAVSSVKSLSFDIINFRKVVNHFIYFNLVILVLSITVLVYSEFLHNPDLQNVDFLSSFGLGILVGVLFVTMMIVAILWLYYYLVYGTFTRRLKKNLKELDRLD